MKKSNRRNFLKQAGCVLGALALCPAVMMAKEPEGKPGGTVSFMYKNKEFTVQGNISYSQYLQHGLIIGNPRTFLKKDLLITLIK